MTPQQKQKLQKTVDFENKQYEKEGSTFRAYLTDDLQRPIAIVDLASNSFPERPEDLRLYKLVKPI